MVFGWDDAIGVGIGALLGGISSSKAQGASQNMSDHQMDFQREMRASAHQTEVQDLRAAGLNPILSAGGSGAAMAQGSMGTAVPDGALAGAKDALMMKQAAAKQDKDFEIADATIANLKASAENSKADTEKKATEKMAIEQDVLTKEFNRQMSETAVDSIKQLKTLPDKAMDSLFNWFEQRNVNSAVDANKAENKRLQQQREKKSQDLIDRRRKEENFKKVFPYR